MAISWNGTERLARVLCTPEATLNGEDGRVLVEALARWVGDDPRPFALLADTLGVRGTDAQYRARTRAFLETHRGRVFIGVLNMGPVVQIIAEMFRIGSGIQVKGFGTEPEARAWLRSRGIPA